MTGHHATSARRIVGGTALTVALLAGAACEPHATTSGSPDAVLVGVEPPEWTPLAFNGPANVEYVDMAAGNNGFVLAVRDADGEPRLLTSPDGTTWTDDTPADWTVDHVRLADDGHVVYATGTDESGADGVTPVQYVWRYDGPGGWAEPWTFPAPPASRFDGADASFHAFAVLPDGVVVARASRARDEVEVWSVGDDGEVTARTVPEPVMADGPTVPIAGLFPPVRVSTPVGDVYVFGPADGLGVVSADAAAELVDGLPANAFLHAAAHDGGAVAAVGELYSRLSPGDPGYVEGGENGGFNDVHEFTVWCTGAEAGGPPSIGSVDPGTLPDEGVSSDYVAGAIVPYGAGFLMLGNTWIEDVVDGIGALWYSSDGCTWVKDEVAANGFDRAEELVAAETSADGVTLLVGQHREGTEAGVPVMDWWRG